MTTEPVFPQQATRVTPRRALAQIVDGLVIWTPAVLVAPLIGSAAGYVAGFVAFVLDLIIMQGTTGWTIGKRLLGVRTVNGADGPPGIGAAVRRTVPLLFEFAGVVALVFILRSPWRQRAGDRWAHTYVIRASGAVVPAPEQR